MLKQSWRHTAPASKTAGYHYINTGSTPCVHYIVARRDVDAFIGMCFLRI